MNFAIEKMELEEEILNVEVAIRNLTAQLQDLKHKRDVLSEFHAFFPQVFEVDITDRSEVQNEEYNREQLERVRAEKDALLGNKFREEQNLRRLRNDYQDALDVD